MFPSQKYHGHRHTSARHRASMGPGCFHPRNSEVRARAVHPRGLQWGRDVSIPEMGQSEKAWRSHRRASMGPGCFHPRNSDVQAMMRSILLASMGPGCFHPRNLLALRHPVLRLRASMGPGCFHPRNPAHERRVGTTRRASMGPGCFHPRNLLDSAGQLGDFGLQWGRDVSIPEIGSGWCRERGDGHASMGPGCFHPRNVNTWALQSANFTLQWGRDVSIPEIAAVASEIPTTSSFNGAGMFPSQKYRPRVLPFAPAKGFNGAGMFPSQKYSSQGGCVSNSVASMGPGCFHPRNAGCPPWGTAIAWLQWGRDVSIPEMPHGLASSRDLACFNGAGMFPSQKCRRSVWTLRFTCLLQRGRDVSIPEICSIRRTLSRPPGFNGAGMFPSQKSVRDRAGE